MTAPAAPPDILYAEDDENDVFLMRHAFKRAGLQHNLVVATDGQHAIDLLSERSQANPARRPALVLLDLNLPKRSGFEVLRWLRADARCADLRTVVLSSSNHQKDMDAARALGANAYFVKPSNVEERLALVRMLQQQWLDEPGAAAQS